MVISRSARIAWSVASTPRLAHRVPEPTSTAGAPVIGPQQTFAGRVNGSDGELEPVLIKIAHFGPARSGQVAHPLPGQIIEVVGPGVTTGRFGDTGSAATSILVVLGSPPPDASVTTAAVRPVRFTSYGVRLALPTAVLLPCSGTGLVTFIPIPASPDSRWTVVPVRYQGGS